MDAVDAVKTVEFLFAALVRRVGRVGRTVDFVGTVLAVNFSVTPPLVGHAVVVTAVERGVGRTGGFRTLISFIRPVAAVVLAVAEPSTLYASAVRTGELVRRARGIYSDKSNIRRMEIFFYYAHKKKLAVPSLSRVLSTTSKSAKFKGLLRLHCSKFSRLTPLRPYPKYKALLLYETTRLLCKFPSLCVMICCRLSLFSFSLLLRQT